MAVYVLEHLKHLALWPTADAKPMANDISACNALAVHVLEHLKHLAFGLQLMLNPWQMV